MSVAYRRNMDQDLMDPMSEYFCREIYAMCHLPGCDRFGVVNRRHDRTWGIAIYNMDGEVEADMLAGECEYCSFEEKHCYTSSRAVVPGICLVLVSQTKCISLVAVNTQGEWVGYTLLLNNIFSHTFIFSALPAREMMKNNSF